VARTLIFIASCILLSGGPPSATFGGIAAYEYADVKWPDAVSFLTQSVGVALADVRKVSGFANTARKLGPSGSTGEAFSEDLRTINAISATLRPKIQFAGSPVLLPVDMERLANEIVVSKKFANKDKPDSYLGELRSLAFHPGPYGYRAYFQMRKTSTIMISGSSIYFNPPPGAQWPQLRECAAIIEAAKTAPSASKATPDDNFFNISRNMRPT